MCAVRGSPTNVLILLVLTGLREVIRSFQTVWKDFSCAFAATCSRSKHSVHLERSLMAKQTTITVETDSLLILRGQSARRGWCPRCEAEVETIAMEDTGVITNLGRSALEEWLNSEELHRLHAADGSAVTCLNSLLARVQNTKTS